MDSFVAKYFGGKKPEVVTTEKAPAGQVGFQGTNAELVSCACKAKNGLKFDALYNRGAWEELYQSKSEARAALYEFLVFYCGPNRERVEALYIDSALFDEKWRDRPDEQERLFTKAVAYCNGKYYVGATADTEADQDPVATFLHGLTFSDLTAGAYLQEPDAPLQWITKDSLLTESVGLIVGPPGVGKSTLTLQLAGAITTGASAFLGGLYEIETPGRVVILGAEDDRRILQRRLRAIRRAFVSDPLEMATDAAAREALEEIGRRFDQNMIVIPFVGQDVRFVANDQRGNLSATPFFKTALRALETLDDTRLVIVDPCSRFNGGDENSNRDAAFFVSLLESLKEKTGATVLAIHHTSKNAGGRGKAFDLEAWLAQDAIRGASGLTGAARWQMNATALPESETKKHFPGDDGHFLAGRVSKKNYGPPEDPFFFRRGPHGVLYFAKSQAKAPRTENIDHLTTRAIETIRELNAAGRSVTQREFSRDYSRLWKTEGVKPCSESLVKLAIEKAIMAGALEELPVKNQKNVPAIYLRAKEVAA
jgi:RecA-family ATPase